MTDTNTPVSTSGDGVPPTQPAAPVGGAPASGVPEPSPEAGAASASDDWRASWADALKLDDKTRDRLTRFTAPHEVFNSYLNLEKKLTDSRAVRVPDANATPEEVAAWNKARGVPDTPDGYKIDVTPPEGLDITDGDKAVLKALTAEAHKRGFDPATVNFAHEFFYQQAAEAAAQQIAVAEQAAIKAEAALKREWGREYETNVKWANAAATQFGLKDMLNTRLADGSLLGDNPVLIKAMAQIGRVNAEDPFMLQAAGQGVGKGVEERKKELMDLRVSDPRRYASQEVQSELERINTALARRQELAGAR